MDTSIAFTADLQASKRLNPCNRTSTCQDKLSSPRTWCALIFTSIDLMPRLSKHCRSNTKPEPRSP